MADGATLGKAYVQIMPSAEGISGKLNSIMSDAGESSGTKYSGKFASSVKKGISGAAKGLTAGAAAAAAGIGAVTAAAVKAYGNYEQLVGGVETLFKKSAGTVEEYANNAYKNAGLSANEYMETITGFSASLLQSLGGDTEKAAEIGNMAVVDMADNANKMGTAMESIQYAYQGFAKQNYTMLDNLKLGYGGTKSEMERLLADAEKLPAAMGRKFDISNYADVVEAIHLVQENMGIAGTTQQEAAKTIQGSVSAMKGAWNNFLVGLSDDTQDLGPLMDNLIGSVATVAENVMPRVATVIESIAKAIPELIGRFAEHMPDFLDMGRRIIENLVNGIREIFPQVLEAAAQLIVTIVQGLANNIGSIVNFIATDLLPTIITTITNNLPTLLEAGMQLIAGLGQGLIAAIPTLIDMLPQIIESIVTTLSSSIPELMNVGVQLLVSLVANLPAIILGIVKAIPLIIVSIVKAFGEGGSKMAEVGKNLIMGLWNGIKNAGKWLWDKIKGFFSGILDKVKGIFGIHSPSKEMAWVGDMLVQGLSNGISDNADLAVKAAQSMADGISGVDYGLKSAIPGVSAGSGASGSVINNSIGNVTINIQAAEGQSPAELAEVVANRLSNMFTRRVAQFA